MFGGRAAHPGRLIAPLIVMAYYAGETLKKQIQRGPLPLMEALDFAIQVTQGLAKAHQGGSFIATSNPRT